MIHCLDVAGEPNYMATSRGDIRAVARPGPFWQNWPAADLSLSARFAPGLCAAG